jgi:DNA-binding NarL/FixJ family response regulator
MIINAESDLEVVGEAANGMEAVSRATALLPDIVLMDVRMPHCDGIEATRLITAALPSVKVVMLTTFDLDEYSLAALRAGASGFLLKSARPPELLAGIRSVASGDAVIAPSTTRRLLDHFASTIPASASATEQPDDEVATLSEREREIFALVARGLTNQEIAHHLTLAEATVKSHVAAILRKLQLRDRVQVVIYAYEHGLTQPER